MFIDYPHHIKQSADNPNLIVKSLADKSTLQKEFYILSFLRKYSFVPRVCNLKSESFMEERLLGKEITEADMADSNIKKLAVTLKKIHTIKIPSNIRRYLHNSYLSNNHYQPDLVIKTIVKNIPAKVAIKYRVNLARISEEIQIKLKARKYQIGLIHGDLSYHNIFLQNKNIVLIDWSDCRLDISSCDVSQLFYLLKFDKRKEKVFLKHYRMHYIDEQLLKYHKILLLLYDLAVSNKKKQSIDQKKIRKLNSLCLHFHD